MDLVQNPVKLHSKLLSNLTISILYKPRSSTIQSIFYYTQKLSTYTMLV